MGYGSDVEFVIRGPAPVMAEVWCKFRLLNPFTPDYASDTDPLGIENLVLSEDNGEMRVHFKAEQWKWYDSYSDIQRIEELWTAYRRYAETPSNEDADQLNGSFIRIGENDDDIESRSFGSAFGGDVSVCRSISCDFEFIPALDIRSKL